LSDTLSLSSEGDSPKRVLEGEPGVLRVLVQVKDLFLSEGRSRPGELVSPKRDARWVPLLQVSPRREGLA